MIGSFILNLTVLCRVGVGEQIIVLAEFSIVLTQINRGFRINGEQASGGP